MPFLIRFLLHHALIGLAVAIATVIALVHFDVAGLGALLRQSESGLLALILLVVFLGLTFGSVQMGVAIMRHGGRSQDTSDR